MELSISLLVLLYLLSGAVEFGLAFFQFVQLRDAAQEGALYGSMNPTDSAPIELRVRSSSSSPINLADSSQVTVAITAYDKTPPKNMKNLTDACEGDALKVEAFYDHHIFMPFIPQLIGRNTITLHAVVTDTILSPVCP